MKTFAPLRLHPLAHAVALAMLACATGAVHAGPPLPASTLPTGGAVSSGSGAISQAGSAMTVNQASQNLSINWQTFSIGKDASVNFVQPNSSAIVLNRVLGSDGSKILGNLSANGQVFLINPNGVLFGRGAQVDVGGLVASTLDLSDADFVGGKRSFSGSGGKVVNKGTITAAPGGYVALIGGQVSNQGTITAQLGTVALGAGSKVTLDFAGDKLLNLRVDEGALKALADNRNLIQADGGTVILTGRATDALVGTVVNNTGVIEARTVENRNGRIVLLGGMDKGTVNVAGTLDASAPNGGDGGFIETSGAQVKVASDVVVTTNAPQGATGTWLIDPQDYKIAASGGDITGATLGTQLASSNVAIASTSGATAGNGDIFVNDAVTWSSANKLTLSAQRNININANITNTSSSTTQVKLALEYGLNAVNAGNLADYFIAPGAKINLLAGNNFSTKLGSNGATTAYTVITALGAQGSNTGTDLQGMRNQLARNYAMGADIDAGATKTWNSGQGFLPVGATYSGIFTGLGHTIKDLNINRPSTTNVGLFARATGTVRDVGLINGAVGGLVSGNTSVGALVGQLGTGNGGTILNAYSDIAVGGSQNVGGLVGLSSSNASVRNSHATGAVTGPSNSQSMGGLIGENQGLVDNSYATGTVTGSFGAGGLVGWNDSSGTISNSYSTSNVGTPAGDDGNDLGGLVGLNYGAITDSRASGSVTGGTYPFFAGALVGENSGTITRSHSDGSVSGYKWIGGLSGDNSGTITDSYSTATVTGVDSNIGGLVGQNSSSGVVTNSTSSGTVSADPAGDGSYVGGLAGLNDGTISGSSSTSAVSGNRFYIGGLVGMNTGSITDSHTSSVGGGSVGSSVQASDIGGLVGHNAATGTISISSSSSEVYAPQSFDVGGLVGNNEGAISGTAAYNTRASGRVTGDISVGGLVGFNDASGSITKTYATGEIVGGNNTSGGLAGTNHGTISDSYATGNVSGYSTGGGLIGYQGGAGTVNNAYATGAINVDLQAGGLIGQNDGQVTNTHASGVVNSSGGSAGGLVGWNTGTIASSYSTSNVGTTTQPGDAGGLVGFNQGSITDTYATGAVTGGYSTGGLVGSSFGGTITRSYASGAVTGWTQVGGLVGSNSSTVTYSYATGPVRGDGGSTGGLLGTNSGNVSNVFATGAVVTDSTPFTNNSYYTGGLIGDNSGSVTGAFATGSVTGLNAVGGLIGRNTGTAGTSYATGAVTGLADSFYVGGLVGQNDGGALTDVYARGNVSGAAIVGGLVGWNGTGGTITRAYATGSVNATDFGAGGLVGSNDGAITDSFWNSQTSGQGSNGIAFNGGTATGTREATTAELQESATQTFYPANAASWDLSNTWYAGGNGAYPILRTSPFVSTVNLGSSRQTYGSVNFSTASNFSNLWYTDSPSSVTGLTVTGASTTSGAGTYTVSGSGASLTSTTGQQYTFIYVPATLDIDPATLTVGANSLSKVYGQADPALTYSLSGLVNGDLATSILSGSLTRAAGNNAGSYAITQGSLAVNPNYTLSYTNGTLTITPKVLTYTLSASDKVYDGTTAASVVVSNLSGFVGAETVTVSGGTGSFNSKDVLTANTVTAAGVTLADGTNGGLAGNYALDSAASATAHITARAVNLSGTRTYDGTTSVAASALTTGTLVGSETLLLSGAGQMADKNAGSKSLSLGTLALGDGANGGLASNYTFTGGTRSVNIDKANITLRSSAVNKTYDGTTDVTGATVGVSSGALFGSDATSGGTFVYNSANAGTGNRTISLSNVTLSDGNGGGNYTVSYADRTGNTINRKSVAVTGTGAYSASTTVAAGTLALSGLVGTETLGLSGTATINNANAGARSVSSVASLTASNGTGLAANYTLATGGAYTVTPKAVSLTANRAYNGLTTLASTTFTLSGLVGGQTLNLTGAGSMADKNADTGKAVTLNTLALTNGTGTATNYTLTGGTHTANITRASITGVTGITANGKVYDATNAATLNTGTVGFTGMIGGDALTVASASGAFTNVNAGSRTVNITGISLGGTDAGNYTLGSTTASTTATISPFAVNLTGSRSYDGTANVAAGIFTLGSLVAGQTLMLGGTGTIGDKNVGTGKTVNTTGLTLGNGTGLASNYTFTGGTQTASVTQAGLTLSANDVSRTYDGTTGATGTARVSSGTLFAGDSLSGGSFAFTDKNVGAGNKTVTAGGVTVGDGVNNGNYAVTYVNNTTSTISQAGLTLSANDVSRTYDGTTGATGTARVSSGTLFSGDSLTGGTFAFTDKNVGLGNKTVTASGVTVGDGTNNGNYSVSYINNNTSTISQANLTLSANDISKTYDGTTSATGTARVSGGTLFSGDALTGGSFAFTDKNVGLGNKAVTAGGVIAGDGVNNGNYSISYTNNTTSTINPFVVDVGGRRAYDGTAIVDAAVLSMTILPAGETLTLSGTATAASRNVGRRSLNVTGLALGDGTGLASNYTLAGAGGTVQIDKADLVIGTINVSKVYDGTTAAAGTAVAMAGTTLFGTDTVTGGSFAFTDRNAGAGNKTVTAGGVTVNDGNNGSNYNLSYADNTTSTINRAPLTVAANNLSKVYGDANPALTGTATGLQAGDTNALITGLATGAALGSGTGGYVIDASGAAAGGNYTVIGTTNGLLTITPAALTVAVDGAARPQGELNPSFSATIAGYKLGENKTVLGGALAFGTAANAGSLVGDYMVSASGLSSSNYSISYIDGILRILPAGGGAFTAAGEVYRSAVANANAKGVNTSSSQPSTELPLIIENGGVLLPPGVGGD